VKRINKDGKLVDEAAGFICDNCIKEIVGGSIVVYFPDRHPSATEPSVHFCSDKCLLKFIEESVNQYGGYKSKVVKPIKPSKEAEEPTTTSGDITNQPTEPPYPTI